jgi:hypothetical protein
MINLDHLKRNKNGKLIMKNSMNIMLTFVAAVLLTACSGSQQSRPQNTENARIVASFPDVVAPGRTMMSANNISGATGLCAGECSCMELTGAPAQGYTVASLKPRAVEFWKDYARDDLKLSSVKECDRNRAFAMCQAGITVDNPEGTFWISIYYFEPADRAYIIYGCIRMLRGTLLLKDDGKP